MDTNIRNAQTIPSKVYYDKDTFELIIDRIFKKNWLYVGHEFQFEIHNTIPVDTWPDQLNIPLFLSKAKNDKIHCLSNVCTHRGNILVKTPTKQRKVSCKYHGRCFNLDGGFVSMPEFKSVSNFPTSSDDLPSLEIKKILFLYFSNVQASEMLDQYFEPILNLMSWYPYSELEHLREYDHSYELNANWALYVDNYLEGFHVPFVHPQLNDKIDYGSYETHCYDYCNVQVGFAQDGEPFFELPSDHSFHNKKVFAFYWWVFPNLMINFYTWGISLNIVQPISPEKTRIHYKTFKLKSATEAAFNETAIEATELEDQEIVLDVQKGVKSILYDRGRFSPNREQGTHHFHVLFSKFLNR